MNWINQIFSDNFTSALGWTILHSIWQGALVAVIFALIMISFRKSSSNFRYTLSVIALLAVFGFSLTTFLTSYEIPQQIDKDTLQTANSQILINLSQNTKAKNSETSLSYFGDYFEGHLPLIVSVWSLGIMILMLRFLGGLAYTQRLKYHHTQSAGDYWQGTLKYLMSELQMQKPVKLLESAMIKAPMVIGTLKPVILVPIGLLSNLPTQQVEMILAHELAHIKRHDYIINILQSIVEIALFFNPFVWWISANIRQERENCCDDIALNLTGDKMTFVKTLANIEAMRLGTPELAMGFAGKKGSLMSRVSRLLNQNYRKSSFSEGFWSAVVLVLCLVMASMTFNTKVEEKDFEKDVKAIKTFDTDTKQVLKKDIIKLDKAIDDTVRFGKDYMLVTYPSGKVEIFKSGQKIAKEDYDKHSEVFEMKDEELTLKSKEPISLKVDKEEENESNLEFSIDARNGKNSGSVIIRDEKGEEMIIEILKDAKTKDGFIIKHDGEIIFDASKFTGNLEKHLKEALSGLENIKLDLENFDFPKEIIEEEIENEVERMEIVEQKMEIERRKMEIEVEREAQREIIKENKKLIEKEKKLIEKEKARIKEEKKRIEKEQKAFKKLKAELIKDGLIDEKPKHFEMSGKHKSIKVNGKALKGDLYNKYEKLLKELLNLDFSKKGSKWTWSYIDK